MIRKYNKGLLPLATQLRKTMTKEERHLWYDFLRNYPVRFYRQKIVGNYIADFYCSKAKLVIEVDGSQHYNDSNIERDKVRTEFFNLYDLEVVRILNRDINENFAGVCAYLDSIVRARLHRE